MRRLRGQWLGDDDDGSSSRINPAPFLSPVEPVSEPRLGEWFDDDGGPAAENKPRRPGVVEAPKWPGIAQAGAGLVFVVLVLTAILGDVNVAKALIVAPVLGYIAYSVAQRLAEADGQPAIVPIIMGGLAVKFCGVMARYWIGLQVYGTSDAGDYEVWGRKIAPGLRHFHLIDIGKLQGTNFLRLVTGVVFAITPASNMVGFLVFGFMSFIGMILFWRAFKRALPANADLRYLQVLMVMPSLAFWPSSIGKDAWMVMGVGLASYGVANILTNRTVLGWGTFIVGIYAVMGVRPHVGIALFVGLVVAELFRSRGSQGVGRAGVSLILLFVIGGIVLSSAAAFLGVSSWSKASVDQELASVGGRTSDGRSEFSPTQVNSPAQFPIAAFTVLFRPMPYETHSPQELASAFENLALLGVIVLSLPRLKSAFGRARRRPYMLYCLGTISVFIVEYSTFSNFALIARERTQITALLLVFLCMPKEEMVVVDASKVRDRSAVRPPRSET